MPSKSTKSSSHSSHSSPSSASSSLFPFTTSSRPSHNSHKRGPKQRNSTSSNKKVNTDADDDHDIDAKGKDEAMWNALQSAQRSNGESSMVLAVVSPDQNKEMSALVRKSQKKKPKPPCVEVTTQDKINSFLSSLPKNKYESLTIIVSSAIRYLHHDIPSFFTNVFIRPCSEEIDTSQLAIASNSTYCGFPVTSWLHQNEPNLPTGRHISFRNSHFRLSEIPGGMRSFSDPSFVRSAEMTDEEMGTIVDDLGDITGQAAQDRQSSNAFNWAKTFIATAVRATASARAFSVGFVDATGIFVHGYGFSGGMGSVTAEMYAGVEMTAAVGVIAGAVVYFIPWGKVLGVLKNILMCCWRWIKTKVTDLWNYIYGLVEKARSTLGRGGRQHHAELSRCSF